MDGIRTCTVPTGRADTFVRHDGRESGEPVLLVHGNISSSVFWEETLLALPAGFRGLAPDLRGYGGTEALPVDASRGLRDDGRYDEVVLPQSGHSPHVEQPEEFREAFSAFLQHR